MITQTPHDVTYVPAKFEVATTSVLGGDTITRNATDGHIDGRADDGATLVRNESTLFSQEKMGIKTKTCAKTIVSDPKVPKWDDCFSVFSLYSNLI